MALYFEPDYQAGKNPRLPCSPWLKTLTQKLYLHHSA